MLYRMNEIVKFMSGFLCSFVIRSLEMLLQYLFVKDEESHFIYSQRDHTELIIVWRFDRSLLCGISIVVM